MKKYTIEQLHESGFYLLIDLNFQLIGTSQEFFIPHCEKLIVTLIDEQQKYLNQK